VTKFSVKKKNRPVGALLQMQINTLSFGDEGRILTLEKVNIYETNQSNFLLYNVWLGLLLKAQPLA